MRFSPGISQPSRRRGRRLEGGSSPQVVYVKDLFDLAGADGVDRERIAGGAVLLRGKALAGEAGILAALDRVVAQAPFRHMTTPGGYVMSIAMTSCGEAGWVTDRSGYRYDRRDPGSGQPWPPLPSAFRALAADAAREAGYPDFAPDSCLINRYLPGARLSLHQDKDERDFSQPIVSVSLGLPVVFQFGGARRSDPVRRYPLRHGDVVVWGGESRLFHHGVLTVKEGAHPVLGRQRINLTFRAAL
ncbi:MAG: DNA oxidative demethylase AlkB [Proteobacteria bacterium]|nr:DNA oxidative demethylase AlkB [Pseudomonadota bacterium]